MEWEGESRVLQGPSQQRSCSGLLGAPQQWRDGVGSLVEGGHLGCRGLLVGGDAEDYQLGEEEDCQWRCRNGGVVGLDGEGRTAFRWSCSRLEWSRR